jgi:hypothetical protein
MTAAARKRMNDARARMKKAYDDMHKAFETYPPDPLPFSWKDQVYKWGALLDQYEVAAIIHESVNYYGKDCGWVGNWDYDWVRPRDLSAKDIIDALPPNTANHYMLAAGRVMRYMVGKAKLAVDAAGPAPPKAVKKRKVAA